MPSHREISAETDREPQQLQNYWSEVRYMVRCIYRQAGTPLADDQDQSLVPDKEGVKELVDRYTLPPASCPFLTCCPGSLPSAWGGLSFQDPVSSAPLAQPQLHGQSSAEGLPKASPLGRVSNSNSDEMLIAFLIK